MPTATKLKPCPFCGSNDVRMVGRKMPRIKCNTCFAWGPEINFTLADALEKWNRRASDDSE